MQAVIFFFIEQEILMTVHNKLSRREFLKGAAIVGTAAATASVASSVTTEPAVAASEPNWHKKDIDILVVGTGFAGLAAAITAAEAGARVLIIEKAPQEYEGGNSKVSGNMWWAPKEGQLEGGLTYAKALSYGTTPDDCLAALVNEMTNLNAWILAKTGITAKEYNLK